MLRYRLSPKILTGSRVDQAQRIERVFIEPIILFSKELFVLIEWIPSIGRKVGIPKGILSHYQRRLKIIIKANIPNFLGKFNPTATAQKIKKIERSSEQFLGILKA